MARHYFDKLYEKYNKTDNPYNLNSKNIERFSTTSSFETNKKVNNDLFDQSTSKIFSNVTSKVIQNNATSTAAAVGSTNTVWLNGIKCKNIVITGIDQTSTAKAAVTSESRQEATSNVSSEITNAITKKISSTDAIKSIDIDKYDAPNIQQLKSYMSSDPLFDIDKALSFGSINQNNVSTLDNSMKKAFNLDNSFNITPSQEISNNIGNTISQGNLATCKASANSQNQLLLNDIQCNNFTMDNIKQKAFSELVMNCVFDQKNTSNITTKITNELKSQYNQIYQTAGKSCGETKSEDKNSICSNPDLLDTWVGASIERMALIAGTLPEAKPKPKPIAPEEETIAETKAETKSETKSEKIEKSETKSEMTPENKIEKTSNELTPNQLLLIGGVGLTILLLLVASRR